jgi:hypothetical protein
MIAVGDQTLIGNHDVILNGKTLHRIKDSIAADIDIVSNFHPAAVCFQNHTALHEAVAPHLHPSAFRPTVNPSCDFSIRSALIKQRLNGKISPA